MERNDIAETINVASLPSEIHMTINVHPQRRYLTYEMGGKSIRLPCVGPSFRGTSSNNDTTNGDESLVHY